MLGDSAGAGSIALHLIAFGGAPTNLFAGVFGISPFFPTQLLVSQLEWQFDLFAARVGCNATADPLACLRHQDSTVLQNANQEMPYPGRTGDSLFPFTPAIDGDLIPDFPYRLFEQGKFVKVPSIFGYVNQLQRFFLLVNIYYILVMIQMKEQSLHRTHPPRQR